MTTHHDIKALAKKAKHASSALRLTPTKLKERVLLGMAKDLIQHASAVKNANKKDIATAHTKKLSTALIDRLLLSDKRIQSMASSLRAIAKLPDPVGVVSETVRRPNGLLIGKMRVPIGVIAIIYESRPHVTADCIGLCLKSGNSVVLRGGSEAINSNIAIFNILNRAVKRYGLPDGCITMIKNTAHGLVRSLLKQHEFIDLVIPRGGEALINEISAHSTIPVIRHYKGVCHVYVDDDANLAMAQRIAVNAKIQRPGVCNAMETLLVHRAVARQFLPALAEQLEAAGVTIRGCPKTRKILKRIEGAREADWYEEYLDLILSVKIVGSIDEAIAHISKYGSQHSDAIVTDSKAHRTKFIQEVDSAAVYVNASTRFTDGGEFGMGAEMGISTDRLHARGPMALKELTTYKYVILGNGQIRT